MFQDRAQILFLLCALIWINVPYSYDYEPSCFNKYGQTGMFNTHSAKTMGMGHLAIITYGNVSRDKNFVLSVKDDNEPSPWSDSLANPAMVISSFDFSIGYGITRYLDLSLSLPLYIDYISSYNLPETNKFGGKIKTGLGDLEFSLKWQYPPYPHKRFFEMAYFGGLSIPTGDRVTDPYFPRHTYYFYKDSSKSVKGFFTSEFLELEMKMLWTFDFKKLRNGVPVEFHMNYGIRWTHADLDHLFLLNAGLSYYPFTWLTLFTDFSGETRTGNVDKGFNIGDDPLRLSPGISISQPSGFFITFGMDIGLMSDKKISYYVLDHDKVNKLITTAIEPQIKFAASIGWSGFVMPQDNDRDGYKDSKDRCPKDPEDYDGFEDEDGCPEKDNDGDGVSDSTDRCPNDKEDYDGFEDIDGCPDFDNDQDGISDIEDLCPHEPEIYNAIDDGDGCPDENRLEKQKSQEIKHGRVILRDINFEFDKTQLTVDSHTMLNQVYASLVKWPEIKVEIKGHTDDVGPSRSNKRIALKRAECVRNYLIDLGISPERLHAIGVGEIEPMADNATKEGRARNRRVELNRID